MDKKLLRNIINTLESIEIKGRDNMDKLLGCINALESMIKLMEAERKSEETEC